ncbi:MULTISPECIES: hypothetical protein [Bacillus cereus group]|uniref:hypothetical protein n=1 Tax=Bacillus cereus group TaxID=86661 RepID=UPI000B4319DE|nr:MULTISPECIES: hypothetical protein [Bacillus cereus group]OTX25912.1 hypothetical protein BK717_31975 [Bacillus thuringiensis serovar malayensis]OUB02405.1 hypothetical protein BK709_27250 [Bacillus thuringiensis serovar shandongiensis]OTY08371.1 hypothetical protein BK734_17730 [Bacillus thuringiensis serovar kim]OUB17595.1 hypothetical protein BK733_17995 [Bacillus thuringiensis serovar xiaguangiensis]WHT91886.1 hypothetical protein QM226_002147 [Bacillus cereus]
MNILNFLMSLFNSKKITQQMFELFGNKKKNNKGWILGSLLGLGTVLGVLATRNSSMIRPIKHTFQGFQNKTRTFIPSKVNLANMEFADEITPNTQKKQSNPN